MSIFQLQNLDYIVLSWFPIYKLTPESHVGWKYSPMKNPIQVSNKTTTIKFDRETS